MGTWLSTLLTAIVAGIGNAILGWWKDDQAQKTANQGAVDKAALTTSQDIAETADAQAANNAVDRGGASDVAARLRKRLADEAGGDVGGAGHS